MANQGPDGTYARLTRLEGDMRDLYGRVSTNEKVLAALPFIREDIEDIKRDCAATRKWVTDQMEAKEREERDEKRLTRGQRLTIIGLSIALIGVLVSAIASLAAAGVFG